MRTIRQPIIETLDSPSPRQQQALRLLLGSPGCLPSDTERRVRQLRTYLERQSLQLPIVLGASFEGRLVSALMVIESPGRLGAVFIPSLSRSPVARQGAANLLREVPQHAWGRSLSLLQTLLGHDERQLEPVYAEAGFEPLAELVYLERAAADPCPACTPIPGLRFVCYRPRRRHAFLETLDRTYLQSMDCPQLSGIRTPAEILATHRATGVHDPNHWFLATLRDEPVGLLLLARVHERCAFEVVYMGVTPAARGTGISDAVLAQAVDVCRRNGSADLTLAVDESNAPARRVYQRWNMRETGRRYAWFLPNPERVS